MSTVKQHTTDAFVMVKHLGLLSVTVIEMARESVSTW